MFRTIKKNLKLREDVEKNYSASQASPTATASQVVSKTKSEHPDATSVVIPQSQADGDSSTPTTTVDVQSNGGQVDSQVKKISTALKNQGINNAQFKVSVKENTKKSFISENVISFTKKEMNNFLHSI